MFLSVFGALVIMMSRLKVSFFRYRSEHAAEKLQLRALTRQCTQLDSGTVVDKNNRQNPGFSHLLLVSFYFLLYLCNKQCFQDLCIETDPFIKLKIVF